MVKIPLYWIVGLAYSATLPKLDKVELRGCLLKGRQSPPS
ncbi:hypothetical protein COO91_08784 [Nostoc flagelliforme CCNUN1]|uniref:Uncharacterized protein n=1 Tax=Nostoc flagelliforme CCNUN1 TaxID=2038116 RepID=A0A2K8T4J1_9NOSO|nr:hypothetical protein COO91_08784 [Nostoc flagelliforme CCNUN1]